MKKRLRKKLHLAEYRALGFRVEGVLIDSLDAEGSDRMFDDWINFIEARGITCGGGMSLTPPQLSMYVERFPRSCTDEDREAACTWLRARAEVVSVDAGALEDVYYPDGHRR